MVRPSSIPDRKGRQPRASQPGFPQKQIFNKSKSRCQSVVNMSLKSEALFKELLTPRGSLIWG